MTTPDPEFIPAAPQQERPRTADGKMTYDMSVNVTELQTFQTGIFDRVPQAVKDQIIDYAGRVRLFIEVTQT